MQLAELMELAQKEDRRSMAIETEIEILAEILETMQRRKRDMVAFMDMYAEEFGAYSAEMPKDPDGAAIYARLQAFKAEAERLPVA